ncbi:MAG: hypothetical protein WDM90_22745 [Ferruginibacter sp.]
MIQNLKMLVRAWHYRLQENPNEIAFIIANANAGDTVLTLAQTKAVFYTG